MKSPFTSPTSKVLFALLLFLSSFWGITPSASAQNIPDVNFAQAIRAVCPTCIDGSNNLLPPAASINTLEIMSKNITDLTGIHGFTSLYRLDCRHNQLTTLPTLPSSTKQIIAADNLLTTLPALPAELLELIVANNALTSLPTLPSTLTGLAIDPDKITCLPNQVVGLKVYRYPADATFEEIATPPTCIHIPDANFAAAIRTACPTCINDADILLPPAASLTSLNVSNKNIADLTGIHGFTMLQILNCGQNQLTILPNLPIGLIDLSCNNNLLISLPSLPNDLDRLVCNDNQLASLPTLPSEFRILVCNNNQLTSLPALPIGILDVWCHNNLLTSLPTIPSNVVSLICANNQLTGLPTLPNSLTTLICGRNQITVLPSLPNNLNQLNCDANQITVLPSLPNSLTQLNCGVNPLTSLPTLPNNLINLSCNSCQLTSLPALPSSITNLNLSGNQLTNLPALPNGLIDLRCFSNQITSLPTLPNTLSILWIDSYITCLPNSIMGLQVYNEFGNTSNLPVCGGGGIHIPDDNFAAAIRAVCPTCIDGSDNLLPPAASLTSLDVSNKNIADLTGIEGFTALTNLNCGQNQLTILPILPDRLTYLYCSGNQLTSLPALPNSLITLYGAANQLTSLPTLPSNLEALDCAANQLTSLPTLPSSLTTLYCGYNQLTQLPSLPSSLITIQCLFNQITSLPTLPNTLAKLTIDADKIPCLPNLVAGLEVYNNVFNSSTNSFTLITTPPVCVVIHIPDDNFAAAIRAVCPTCIDGDDNLLPPAASLTYLDVSNKNIADLTGIHGFAALTELYCNQNQLTTLPTLPSSLTQLNCSNNQLTSLPTLPTGLTGLSCYSNQLTSLPTLPTGLTDSFSCSDNKLTSLPNLPNGIVRLICYNNQLSSLPELPTNLIQLVCDVNQLTTLPSLPNSLKTIYCGGNKLSSLPTLPNSLEYFNCYSNEITTLPALPNSINHLNVFNNKLSSLPTLPSSLKWLYGAQNQFTNLPALPDGLLFLDCANSLLLSLPSLPNSLNSLKCNYNRLTVLPALPSNLDYLFCDHNSLTSLPTLPNELSYLAIDEDKITCLPNSVAGLQVYNSSFTLITTPPVCASCEPPTGRQSLNSTATSAQVSWQAEAGKSYKVRWRALNAPNWIEGVVSPNLNATIIYTISGLTNATSFEWQIQSICNNVGGDFSPSLGFTTACQPGNLGTPLPSTTFATLNWGDVGVPVTSNLRWRIMGTTRWTTANAIAGTTHQITGLTPGSNYEVQIQTVCMDGSASDFSASTLFTTTACPIIPPVTSNSPVCAGEMVILTASGGGTYLWTCPGGNCPSGFNTTSPTPSFIGSTTNDGTYSVTITTPDGCTAKLTVAVVVRPRPTASITSNSPVCVGSSLSLQSSIGTSYTWTCPNGNCNFDPSVRNPSFITTSTDQSGNYSVTVANTYGCTASASVAVTVNPLPTVTASSNSPVCIGGTIQLQASGGTTYAWKGPGGFSSTLANPTRVAATNLAGVYTVTITNATGCSVTNTVNVEVNPFTPNPVTSNSPVCEGETVTLTASGGSSYQWTCPGGNCPNGFSATSATPSFIGSSSNDGTYSVTITTPEGCTAKSSIAIVVRPKPKATANANGPVCVGEDLTLQASGGTTYTWTCPNGNCGFDNSLRNPTFTPNNTNQSGNYSVTVTNTYGCSASAAVAVKVNPLPTVTVSSNSPVCVGGTIRLQATGGGTYLWKGPGGFTSTSPNPTRIAAANLAGTYTVTVTNNTGCALSSTTIVEVTALPIATISTNTDKTVVCGNTPLILSAALQNGATYQWKRANTAVGSNTNTLSVTSGGIYKLQVTNASGCINTDDISITTQPALNAVAAHTITQAQGVATLKLTANPAGLKYSWSGPTGFTSTARNPSISPVSGSNAGTYTLTVTETATACTASATTNVVLSGAARLAAEEEIMQEQSIQMVIAPNPTSGKMTVEIRLPMASTIELNWINLSGKTQQQWQSEQSATFHRLEVDVTAFPDGIYFLRAQTGNGQSISEKVIKRAN